MCRYFMEKLEETISQKPKGTKNRMAGKQTTITFNNSQRTKETLGLYMHESGMSELVDTGNQQSNKRLTGKKYFMYFENTKILRLNVFKYKIH